MLNYGTILSSYDDRLTLLQWLKKVEAALAGASLDNFVVSYEGNGEYKFKAHFADGSEIESNLVALQGVENAYLAAGNELHLVLTNGEDINVGNLLNGDLNVNGDITASGNITQSMVGYSYTPQPAQGITLNYVGVSRIGDRLTFAIAGTLAKYAGMPSNITLGYFVVPADVAANLYPNTLGALDNKTISFFNGTTSFKNLCTRMSKSGTTNLPVTLYSTYDLTDGQTYEFRYEVTFLLSENLAI